MNIKKIHYKSKKFSDGSHPVMIRLTHKSKLKYVSTGVRTKYWGKNDCVIAPDSERQEKNQKIEDIYQKFKNRQNELEKAGIEPTIEMILQESTIGKPICSTTTNFLDIVRMKAESCAKYQTKKEYDNLEILLKELYGDYIDVNSINQIWFDAFIGKLNELKGDKNRTKNIICQKLKTCYEYGVARDLVLRYRPLSYKPFKCERNVSKTNLDLEEITTILNAYKKDCVAQAKQIKDNHKDAIMLFALHLAFQGIAPADMARIKVKDVKFDKIKKIEVDTEKYNNDIDYKKEIDESQEERKVVKIKIRRKKSDIGFTVCADEECCRPLLEYYLEGKGKEEYLLPIMEKLMNDNKLMSDNKLMWDKKFQENVGHYYTNKVKRLKTYLKQFCKIWEGIYKEPEHITYYQARHAFIDILAYHSNNKYPLRVVKNMVGQITDDVIAKHYMNEVPEWTQSEATRDIFNRTGESIVELMKQRPKVD